MVRISSHNLHKTQQTQHESVAFVAFWHAEGLEQFYKEWDALDHVPYSGHTTFRNSVLKLLGRTDMDARLRRRIQKLCDEYPNEIAEALLESTFWLNGLDLMTPYVRHDDDTRKGLIRISFSHDQDAWIEVWSEIDPNDVSFSHRFRVPLSGGGESPRVRNALLMLALAIKCDNQQIPQNRV